MFDHEIEFQAFKKELIQVMNLCFYYVVFLIFLLFPRYDILGTTHQDYLIAISCYMCDMVIPVHIDFGLCTLNLSLNFLPLSITSSDHVHTLFCFIMDNLSLIVSRVDFQGFEVGVYGSGEVGKSRASVSVAPLAVGPLFFSLSSCSHAADAIWYLRSLIY